MSGVERHGSCHPVPATARTVPWSRYTPPLLPLREDLGPPCHSRNHVSLISRGARGSEAGARGSGLAAERRSVVVMYGTTTPDYETGAALWHRITTQVGVFPSFRGTHRHGDALRADGGLVTLTIGLFTLGVHLDRNMSGGWASCSGSHRLSACSP